MTTLALRSEKLRIETIVAAIFARRMGLPLECLLLPRKGPDEAGPDAVLKFDTRDVVVELTMADPEGTGALPAGRKGTDILTGGLRRAYERLFKAFNELESRPLSVEIRFRATGEAQVIRLPNAHEISEFIAELSELSRRLAAQPNAFRRLPHRPRGSLELVDFTGFNMLAQYCRSIDFRVPPNGHGGSLSSIQCQSLWCVYADIDAIVQSKSQKSGANWLVVFEWFAPGALPPNDELPVIRQSCFERIFMLDPAMPGRLLEWVSKRWEAPGSLAAYSSAGEIEFVNCFLKQRGIPTIEPFPATASAP